MRCSCGAAATKQSSTYSTAETTGCLVGCYKPTFAIYIFGETGFAFQSKTVWEQGSTKAKTHGRTPTTFRTEQTTVGAFSLKILTLRYSFGSVNFGCGWPTGH